jgi:DNA-binding transcriptional ArsR family regulator
MKQKKQLNIFSEAALEMIAARFKLLSEPVRLKLILCLQEQGQSVSDLVEQTGLSQPNISRHLAKLTEAGVLSRKKEGLNVHYSIADPAIFDLCGSVCGHLRKDLSKRSQAFGV